MSSWQGKTRGGILGYKIFIWTIQYLGIPFAYFLLRFVITWFVFNSREAFRAIYSFSRHILHYSALKSLVSIFRNYYIFGQILIDKLAMLSGFQHRFTFDFEGEEYLRSMHGGGLLISAHVGNWEIAGNLLNRLNKPIHILLFDAEHQRIKGYLEETLKERNVHFIVIREDYNHLKEIELAFTGGDIIAMHGDRFIEGNKTVTVDFMGKPARFPVGPVNLAARFRMPLSFVFAVKETRKHYHFYATPLYRPEFSRNLQKREEILKEAVTAYVRKLEEILREYPLQWFNYYDFWKQETQLTT
ncbi:MAG: lipid A biosynthesis acyltransferase [Bacteroidetes bacterium]|nr:MAG: lipid A biosynthesis acyltransferase [Bacteroidota bacterium]